MKFCNSFLMAHSLCF